MLTHRTTHNTFISGLQTLIFAKYTASSRVQLNETNPLSKSPARTHHNHHSIAFEMDHHTILPIVHRPNMDLQFEKTHPPSEYISKSEYVRCTLSSAHQHSCSFSEWKRVRQRIVHVHTVRTTREPRVITSTQDWHWALSPNSQEEAHFNCDIQ